MTARSRLKNVFFLVLAAGVVYFSFLFLYGNKSHGGGKVVHFKMDKKSPGSDTLPSVLHFGRDSDVQARGQTLHKEEVPTDFKRQDAGRPVSVVDQQQQQQQPQGEQLHQHLQVLQQQLQQLQQQQQLQLQQLQQQQAGNVLPDTQSLNAAGLPNNNNNNNNANIPPLADTNQQPNVPSQTNPRTNQSPNNAPNIPSNSLQNQQDLGSNIQQPQVNPAAAKVPPAVDGQQPQPMLNQNNVPQQNIPNQQNIPGNSNNFPVNNIPVGNNPSQPVGPQQAQQPGVPQNNLPGQGNSPPQQNLGQVQPAQNNISSQQNSGGQPAAQVKNLPGQPQSKLAGPQANIQQGQPIVHRPADLHPDVNLLSAYPPPGLVLPHRDCIPLPKSPRPGVQICIHPIKDDRWVSGSLKQNRLWEGGLLTHMQTAMENDSSLMLMDLGCNIGEYTLWAAALGRPVLAIEMLMNNVQLVQTSLQISGLADRVTIVNNAVYRDHRTLETQFMSQNIGGSRLNTSKVYEPLDTKKAKVSVRTICIDDLIPLVTGKNLYIKMDIENSEHHALACAHKFFTQVNVKIVQMEWMHKTDDESSQVLDFMNLHGYVVSKSASKLTPVPSMGGDVFFLKKSAFGMS